MVDSCHFIAIIKIICEGVHRIIADGRTNGFNGKTSNIPCTQTIRFIYGFCVHEEMNGRVEDGLTVEVKATVWKTDRVQFSISHTLHGIVQTSAPEQKTHNKRGCQRRKSMGKSGWSWKAEE